MMMAMVVMATPVPPAVAASVSGDSGAAPAVRQWSAGGTPVTSARDGDQQSRARVRQCTERAAHADPAAAGHHVLLTLRGRMGHDRGPNIFRSL